VRQPHILVIDPAMETAELDCFNRISVASPLPCTYHLPALYGMDSILRDEEGAVGIVIFGSSSSVNDRHPWQPSLESWLLPKMQKKIPTIGFCYGHQMIAHMFGSKVDFLFPDQHKLRGFQEATLSANPLWGNKTLQGPLYVSHREVVTNCPADMIVTAKRPEVPIDGLAHKQLPVWTFQTHPEATQAFVQEDGQKEASPSKQFEFGHKLVQEFLNFVSKQR
jgi:GMP synthase (glutamine-hydrolysing)